MLTSTSTVEYLNAAHNVPEEESFIFAITTFINYSSDFGNTPILLSCGIIAGKLLSRILLLLLFEEKNGHLQKW